MITRMSVRRPAPASSAHLAAVLRLLSAITCCASLLSAPHAAAQPPTIETVAIVRSTTAGVGGAPMLRERAFILFRDGRVTRALSTPPEHLPAAGQSAGRSSDWGRWQLLGGSLQIQWNDGRQARYATWYRGRPGRSGETLSGVYRSLRGGGAPAGQAVAVAARLQFQADGSYSSDTQVGATAPGVGGAARGAGRGRYRIDGYTITMTDAGGRTTRSTFYVFPDGPSMIGIGSRVFVRD